MVVEPDSGDYFVDQDEESAPLKLKANKFL
jgi:hypothetical protein